MRRFLSLFTVLMLCGIVKDNTGTPLPSASIVISGTNIGTASDQNGHFSITAKNGAILIITALDHKSQEVRVAPNRASYDIQLESSVKTMDELIVTAGGIKTKRREIGTATTVIGNGVLTAGKALNVAAGLQGKVAGLQISGTSGGVNPNFRLVLRGQRSLTGNN
jgi:hypothetical protein